MSDKEKIERLLKLIDQAHNIIKNLLYEIEVTGLVERMEKELK